MSATDRATDRAGGAMQGALDAAQGTAHEVRAGDRDHHPDDRETAARERWETGLPARNAFERDHFLQMEHEVTVGRNYLDRVAKQASAVEASREDAMAGPEAGS